jgi:hypothetical protein
MEISIHDNYLLSYFVDAEKAEIHLHTAFLDGDANEYTDVIFAGVAAYHFESDNFKTILFDIHESELSDIYEGEQNLFERLKNYGWPTLKYESKEELLTLMQKRGVKGFVIHSSYGLSGWIWAKSMTKRPK